MAPISRSSWRRLYAALSDVRYRRRKRWWPISKTFLVGGRGRGGVAVKNTPLRSILQCDSVTGVEQRLLVEEVGDHVCKTQSWSVSEMLASKIFRGDAVSRGYFASSSSRGSWRP
jgi:hypothetical protein